MRYSFSHKEPCKKRLSLHGTVPFVVFFTLLSKVLYHNSLCVGAMYGVAAGATARVDDTMFSKVFKGFAFLELREVI